MQSDIHISGCKILLTLYASVVHIETYASDGSNVSKAATKHIDVVLVCYISTLLSVLHQQERSSALLASALVCYFSTLPAH